jgi:hypothetical protein
VADGEPRPAVPAVVTPRERRLLEGSDRGRPAPGVGSTLTGAMPTGRGAVCAGVGAGVIVKTGSGATITGGWRALTDATTVVGPAAGAWEAISRP